MDQRRFSRRHRLDLKLSSQQSLYLKPVAYSSAVVTVFFKLMAAAQTDYPTRQWTGNE
jgi:hypothetical protein